MGVVGVGGVGKPSVPFVSVYLACCHHGRCTLPQCLPSLPSVAFKAGVLEAELCLAALTWPQVKPQVGEFSETREPGCFWA